MVSNRDRRLIVIDPKECNLYISGCIAFVFQRGNSDVKAWLSRSAVLVLKENRRIAKLKLATMT